MLEDKILEVEKNLQNLGVNIGTYDAENSFCTINFSLNETAGAIKETSLKFGLKCAKRSFFWTLGVYALLGVLTLCALTAIVIYLKLMVSLKKTMMSDRVETKPGRAGNQNDNPPAGRQKDSSGEK